MRVAAVLGFMAAAPLMVSSIPFHEHRFMNHGYHPGGAGRPSNKYGYTAPYSGFGDYHGNKYAFPHFQHPTAEAENTAEMAHKVEEQSAKTENVAEKVHDAKKESAEVENAAEMAHDVEESAEAALRSAEGDSSTAQEDEAVDAGEKYNEWPEVLALHVSKGEDKYSPKGQLLRGAWYDDNAREEIAKIAMDGLVPCGGAAPASGEEFAENLIDLAEHFIGASSSPSAGVREQSQFFLLTESVGDLDSTCGYTPNSVLAFAGVNPQMCQHWRTVLIRWAPKEVLCEGESCRCPEPTFNRKYVVRAADGGLPELVSWWNEDIAASKVRAPMRSQHNFKAQMAAPTWVGIPAGKSHIKERHVPRRGDLFLFRDTGSNDAGHVGIVHTMTDEAPDAAELSAWRYKMKTIDSGQVCPGPSKMSWPSSGPGRKTFAKTGWQCLIGPLDRTFSGGKIGNVHGLINRGAKTRRIDGFINVREYVDRDNAIPREQRFSPENRWCTPKFLARVKAGEFLASEAEDQETDTTVGIQPDDSASIDAGDQPGGEPDPADVTTTEENEENE